MSSRPTVSVLMPLYNGEQYIQEAVESILMQTWSDYEFLIIDDGSIDRGPDIVSSINDERIVLVRNANNMGVAATLNHGLSIARGRYIARMDADDISLPKRLENQVQFMDQHPEVGISGGWVHLFGGGLLPNTGKVPSTSSELDAYMLFENPIWHMTAIMRKELLDAGSLTYNPIFSRSEDYDLWARASQHFSLANIDQVLVRVRRHKDSVTRSNWDVMTKQTEAIQTRLLQRIGLHLTSAEGAFHHRVGRGYRAENMKQITSAENWLKKIITANTESVVYNDNSLREIIGKVWFRLCSNSGTLGAKIWHTWRSSVLANPVSIDKQEQLRFIVSIIWHMIPRKTR